MLDLSRIHFDNCENLQMKLHNKLFVVISPRVKGPPWMILSRHLLFWCNIQQPCGLTNMAAAAVSGNVSR